MKQNKYSIIYRNESGMIGGLFLITIIIITLPIMILHYIGTFIGEVFSLYVGDKNE